MNRPIDPVADRAAAATPDVVWAEAAQRYRSVEPPDGLEATLLARFGELRASGALAGTPVPSVASTSLPARRGWRHLAGHVGGWLGARVLRPHPVTAGAFSLCVVLAFAAPWWLPLFGAATEQTTPFMLVAEPAGGRLDVAQMVRVSVSREAMLDFGIPVPPQKLQEPVGAEMLLGQRGELLAVRFIEKPERKRMFFN